MKSSNFAHTAKTARRVVRQSPHEPAVVIHNHMPEQAPVLPESIVALLNTQHHAIMASNTRERAANIRTHIAREEHEHYRTHVWQTIAGFFAGALLTLIVALMCWWTWNWIDPVGRYNRFMDTRIGLTEVSYRQWWSACGFYWQRSELEQSNCDQLVASMSRIPSQSHPRPDASHHPVYPVRSSFVPQVQPRQANTPVLPIWFGRVHMTDLVENHLFTYQGDYTFTDENGHVYFYRIDKNVRFLTCRAGNPIWIGDKLVIRNARYTAAGYLKSFDMFRDGCA